MYTDDLVEKGYDASADIRQAAKHVLGGGGGQKSLATAGGKDCAGLDAAAKTMIELATR